MLDPVSNAPNSFSSTALPENPDIEAWLRSLTAANNSAAYNPGQVSSTAIADTALSADSPIAANSLLGVWPASAYVLGGALGKKAGPFQGLAAFYLVPPNGDFGKGTFMLSSPQVSVTTLPIIAAIIKQVKGVDIPTGWSEKATIGGLPVNFTFVMSIKPAALWRAIETGSINSIGPGDVEFGIGGVVPLSAGDANAGAMFVNARIDSSLFLDSIQKITTGNFTGTLSLNAGVMINGQAALATIAAVVGAAPFAARVLKTQEVANSFLGMAWRYSLKINKGEWSITAPDGTTVRSPLQRLQDATRPAHTTPTGSPYYAALPVLNFGNPVLAKNNIMMHLVWGANIWSIANSTEGKNFGVGAVEVANRFLAFARDRNVLTPYVAGRTLRLQNNEMRRIILNELTSADTSEQKQQILSRLANRYGIDFGIPELKQANAKLMSIANANGVPTDYTLTRQVFQGSFARSAGFMLSRIDTATVVAAANDSLTSNTNGIVVASSSLSGLNASTTSTSDDDYVDLIEVLIEDPTIEDPTTQPWDKLLGDVIMDAISNTQSPGTNVDDPETALDHLGIISFETSLPAAEKAKITAAVTAAFADNSPPTAQEFAKLLEDMRSQYAAGSPEDVVIEEAIATAAIAVQNGLAGFSKVQLDRAIKQLEDAGNTGLTSSQQDVFRVEFSKLMRDEAMLTQPAFQEALRRAQAEPVNPPSNPGPNPDVGNGNPFNIGLHTTWRARTFGDSYAPNVDGEFYEFTAANGDKRYFFIQVNMDSRTFIKDNVLYLSRSGWPDTALFALSAPPPSLLLHYWLFERPPGGSQSTWVQHHPA